jgi:single-stranded DNA-binding protein
MNIHIVEGNLGKAELRFTETGKAVLNFTLAASNDYYDQKAAAWVRQEPTWFEGALWAGEAEKNSFLQTGMRVQVVAGGMKLRPWEANGKQGTALSLSRIRELRQIQKHGGNEAQAQEETVIE